MALARPLFVGFSSACRTGREGGDLEVTVQTASGPRAFTLPWFFVRRVDELLEAWRREEHEATLLAMHDGRLDETLFRAAEAGGPRDTAFLLSHGAEVNSWLEDTTVLEVSAQNGHLVVVRLLLDAGAADLANALCAASSRGHAAVVALLLDRGADIHDGGNVALTSASHGGHLETVRVLLDRGADIHARGDTALKLAILGERLDSVRLLLDRGAVFDANGFGLAARNGHVELVRLLIERGADIQACTAVFQTAMYSGHVGVVRLLLDRGVELHRDDLCMAVQHGRPEVARLLLERGALAYAERSAALPIAATAGNLEMVRVLLDAGVQANMNIALHCAHRNRHNAVVQLLLERGANARLLPGQH